MAKATKHEPIPQPYTVMLELSKEEAEALRYLCWQNLGAPSFKAIWQALTDAEVGT